MLAGGRGRERRRLRQAAILDVAQRHGHVPCAPGLPGLGGRHHPARACPCPWRAARPWPWSVSPGAARPPWVAPACGWCRSPPDGSCSRAPTSPTCRTPGSRRSGTAHRRSSRTRIPASARTCGCSTWSPSHSSCRASGPPRSVARPVVRALDQVRLRPAQDLLERYPHTLSGGQRQRVNIARAMVLEPVVRGRGRAGVDDRRLEPGGDPGAPARVPGGAGRRLPVHHPRPGERPPLRRPYRGDVPGSHRGDWRRRGSSSTTRCTRTRGRCWRPCRNPIPPTVAVSGPW